MSERRSEDELRNRVRQQAAVADLGRRALMGLGLRRLVEEATRLVAVELDAPCVTVEPEPGEALLPAVDVGNAQPNGDGSTAGVAIGTGERPLGRLAVASGAERDFTDDDLHFLQGIANTLAAAVERERVERELRASEVRFRELADTAPVFIWTADHNGLVDFINRGWIEFTGRRREEELGDTWSLGVHPDDAERVRSSWWRAFSRRVPWELEYRLLRRDGEYRWIVDRGVPRFDSGHELLGYVGTATDIHDRHEMEEKLALARARDHEVAETLQRSLLPDRLPEIDGVDLEARYLPAEAEAAIGGDWYDAMELDDGRVAVVVGDVVGHGLRAAAVMGQLRNAFRAYALVESSPAGTLSRLNRLVAKDTRELMATALYLQLDRDTGEVRYSSAGHPPPLLIEPGGARFLEGAGSVPLGTADPVAYREEVATIPPGSTLVMYTDGLVERRDTPLDDRMAQLVAVAQVAGGELPDMCDQLLEGVLGGRRALDDVALMAVRLEPMGTSGIDMRLQAEPSALSSLRRRLGRFLKSVGASDQERYEITLAACEAAGNAIEHAYGPGDADFELEARLEEREIAVVVRDHGAWRPRRGEDRGRGLRIIDGLMDETLVDATAAGTTVTMRRRLDATAAAA